VLFPVIFITGNKAMPQNDPGIALQLTVFIGFIGALSQLPNQPLPQNPQRIVLLNPTRYLGNLLLAGGLVQDFAAQCREQNREFLLVLDESFKELCAAAFAGVQVLWYPRQAIRRARFWTRIRLFLAFLGQLRRFRADLAFNIEEDSLASRLTQLSGARFRLGCSLLRHRFGYEHVLPIEYAGRHRWCSFNDVFRALGLPERKPAYINLHINQPDKALMQRLLELGVDTEAPLVAIHPAATKDYKKWPEAAFTNLCNILIDKGFSPVLLGAGADEWQRCDRIQRGLGQPGAGKVHNLCNQLTLVELAGFFRLCTGIVGNDSGPSHLAATQGLPGVVVFGPSEPAIWGPLGARSQVLRKAELCDPRCSRRACFADYRCLTAITPEEAFEALSARVHEGAVR
jgi:ADP-heptose:LPS heptosyltransferase